MHQIEKQAGETKMKTVKIQFQVQYRLNSFWYPLQDFKTKKEAEDYANSSVACQRNGYKIVKQTKQI